jgi:hypothetical protein
VPSVAFDALTCDWQPELEFRSADAAANDPAGRSGRPDINADIWYCLGGHQIKLKSQPKATD